MYDVLKSETRDGDVGVAAAYRNDFHRSLHPDLSPERVDLLRIQKIFMWVHGCLDADFDLDTWIEPRPLQAAHKLLALQHIGASHDVVNEIFRTPPSAAAQLRQHTVRMSTERNNNMAATRRFASLNDGELRYLMRLILDESLSAGDNDPQLGKLFGTLAADVSFELWSRDQTRKRLAKATNLQVAAPPQRKRKDPLTRCDAILH